MAMSSKPAGSCWPTRAAACSTTPRSSSTISAAKRLSSLTQQDVDGVEGEAGEHQQRPVGDRQGKEFPGRVGAQAVALEEPRHLFAGPVDEALPPWLIGRAIDAFGETLQPHLVGGDEGAAGRGGQEQQA